MLSSRENKRKELLTRCIITSVKKRIVKSLVWSVALYCVETSREVMEGRMVDRRDRGRLCTGLLDELIGKYTYENMETAVDRLGWRIWTPWICHIFEF